MTDNSKKAASPPGALERARLAGQSMGAAYRRAQQCRGDAGWPFANLEQWEREQEGKKRLEAEARRAAGLAPAPYVADGREPGL